jgi:hypothetical protein
MKSIRPFITSFALLFILFMGTIAQAEDKNLLKPVDEAAQNPSFFVFRARLIEAIAKRDTKHLLSIVDPGIINETGEDKMIMGIAGFREEWKPEAKDSKIWGELGKVLSMGGKFKDQGKSFEAPYVTACFPEGLEHFENSAILGEKVRLRKEPRNDAEVIATLSWDIVKMPLQSDEDENAGAWKEVTTMDGRKGYVSSDYVFNMDSYTAIFEYRSGRWMMVMFAAGC